MRLGGEVLLYLPSEAVESKPIRQWLTCFVKFFDLCLVLSKSRLPWTDSLLFFHAQAQIKMSNFMGANITRVTAQAHSIPTTFADGIPATKDFLTNFFPLFTKMWWGAWGSLRRPECRSA